MKKEGRLTILTTLVLFCLVPAVTIALVISTINAVKLEKSLEDSALERLKVASEGLNYYYGWDLRKEGIDYVRKEDYEHEFVDNLRSQFIEQTFFIADTRFITSVKGEDGKRIEGTKADPKVYAEVCKGDNYFSTNAEIGGKIFYAYYTPVKDAKGKVAGMAFAGEPASKVSEHIFNSIKMTFAISFLLTCSAEGSRNPDYCG